VKDAGQVFVKNGVHVIERGGAALALVGIDDPHAWRADDPQDDDLEQALRITPPAKEAFRILLAHRPGAFDGAAPRGIPLTLAATFTAGSSICGDRVVPGPADHEIRDGPLHSGHQSASTSVGESAWSACRYECLCRPRLRCFELRRA